MLCHENMMKDNVIEQRSQNNSFKNYRFKSMKRYKMLI